MLLPRIGLLLGLKNFKILAESLTGLERLNNIINETSLSSHERIGEVVRVLGLVLLEVLTAEDNLDSTFSTHDSNLAVGPRVVGITAEMLGGHDAVGTTVGLTGNDGDLGDGGFSVSVDELGTLTNNTVVLLVDTGEETGDIDEGHDGDVEGIAEADETSALHRGVDVQATGEFERLVGDNTHSATLHATETNNNVLGEVGGDFEELVIIDDHLQELLHIIGHVGVSRDNVHEGGIGAVTRIVADTSGNAILVVQGEVVVELAHGTEHLDIVIVSTVSDTGLLGVDGGTTELFLSDLFSSDGLDDIGTGDEHVGGIAHHEDEIGNGRGVHSTTSARTHDQGDLRNHTRGKSVTLENLRVTSQRIATFLNTSTARIVQTDHGSTHIHSLIHHLADLLSIRARKRTAQHGEILGKEEDQTAVDGTMTRDNTITRIVLLLHTKVSAAVSLQLVVFAEGTLIHEQLNSFTSAQLTSLVLRFDTLFTSTDNSLVTGFSKSLSKRLGEINSSSEATLQNQHKLGEKYSQTHSTLGNNRRNRCEHSSLVSMRIQTGETGKHQEKKGFPSAKCKGTIGA